MRKIKICVLLPTVVCALLAAFQTYAAELTNERILGALPPSFDNVGIVRYHELDESSVVGGEFLREAAPVMASALPNLPLISFISRHLRIEGMALGAFALSNLDMGSGVGPSARSVFGLYVAENSLEPLIRTLENRSPVQQISHQEYRIFSEERNGSVVYAAFIDDRTILTSDQQDDILAMALALQSEEIAEDSSNWRQLKDVDIDAPVLILRDLQFPMAPPPGFEVPSAENFILGMWMTDMSAPVFELEAATELDVEAAENYITTVGGIEALSGPEGMALRLQPRTETDSNISGTLTVVHSEMGDHYTDLVFHWMLGNWFSI
ncbi:MAG: hypothetical protein VYE29_13075 [Pseudomonadota bacterium]|nr:hypothetical protein [Pseudomonadota bacterium]